MICLLNHGDRIETLLQDLAVLHGAHERLLAENEFLKARLAEQAQAHMAEVEKLDTAIKELRRELSMVTNDILVSMGIRQLPSGESVSSRASGIPQAEKHEDRMDDELAGLSVVNWQAEAQRLEWEAYSADQKLELQEYVKRLKAQKEAQDAKS